MSDGPHPLDYNATINRMEPGIAPVDPMISLASIAISMRALLPEVIGIRTDLADIRYAINSHGNNFNGIVGIVSKFNDNVSGSLMNITTHMSDVSMNIATITKGLTDG